MVSAQCTNEPQRCRRRGGSGSTVSIHAMLCLLWSSPWLGRRSMPQFVSAAAWMTPVQHQSLRHFSKYVQRGGGTPPAVSHMDPTGCHSLPTNSWDRSPTFRSHSGSMTSLLVSPFYFADQIDDVTSTAVVADATMARRETTARIQILMSDTGGGHRASANALRDAFAILTQSSTTGTTKVECDIVDIYTDYAPVWPFKDYVSVYQTLAATPWMWDVVYQFGATPFGMWLNARLLEWTCRDGFTQCMARTTPAVENGSIHRRADLVISVHPLTQALPLQILSRLDARDTPKHTPFCTVVTDLGSAHPTWFHPGVDVCFVPSDALNRFAQQRGLQSSQIKQYGLPIRKGFWASTSDASTLDKRDLRQKLGLDMDRPVVLVVGGGDGMGGLVDISQQLGQTLGRDTWSQMAVVCGKNQKAKQQLDATDEWGPNVRVVVQGFVNNMDEWMRASDVLVTKAGPGTIAEASICGLPCMMFSYLPGQEEGNIPFVQDAGFGTYSSNPTEIASTVSSWLSSPEQLDRMQKAALAAARPQATMDIARDILSLLEERRSSQP